MSETVKSEMKSQAATADYPLHALGWKSFQDLAISVAEECLRRPVQSFLPTADAGRDGAFVGKWEGDDPAAGESTIQCKFTSQPYRNLTLSQLADELEKARALATKGLAVDYIILTNHPITGANELKIKAAFEQVGVGKCRVFGYDWIVRQIRKSPRLRMMAPRLYGLGDLSDLLDARAYEQAQLILSALGNDLQRLVVTDAHRKSVRAISEHNLVLLLGAPATGKSTIGAGIAVGAADIWQSSTIRATSPADVKKHLKAGGKQFFWIDDAWGTTQYLRGLAEEWNQIFPLMQGGIKDGSRFLFTSRDYIWKSAKQDLKLNAIPVLGKSQVIINVQELSVQEKAQILYNHMKLGDQPVSFRTAIKEQLPEIAVRQDFLPEVARRLGSTFFAGKLSTTRGTIGAFFEKPKEFLLETITNLSLECRSALALIFMNGGGVRSPVQQSVAEPAADAFGVSVASLKAELENLNGSLLLLARDEFSQYWTYKHPTVGDAFAAYVAQSPELVEVYLRGARAQSIAREVVCAGIDIFGAPVIVPHNLHELLAERMKDLESYELASFLSYRANAAFARLMLGQHPNLLERLRSFSVPIKEDLDAQLLAALYEFGLLPEEIRSNFVEKVRRAAVEDADDSVLDEDTISRVLTEDERASILAEVEVDVLGKLEDHIDRVRRDWSSNYSPTSHFESFVTAIEAFADALGSRVNKAVILQQAQSNVDRAIESMNEEYEPDSSTAAPISTSTPQSATLINLFRDIDE